MLAHLRTRQEQTTPTFAEMESWVQTACSVQQALWEKKKEVPLFERTFGQQWSVQQVFCQNALVPKGFRSTFSNDFRDDMALGELIEKGPIDWMKKNWNY